MKKKTFLSLATAVAMVATVFSNPATVKADDVTFTAVTYNFECTEFVGEDTIELTGSSASWASPTNATYDVKAAGEFEMTLDYGSAQTGFVNLGYFVVATSSVDNVYKLTSVEINDVEFAIEVAGLKANTEGSNGLPNIWSGLTATDVVAESANGSKIYGGDTAFTITWAAADLGTGGDGTTGGDTTTGGDGTTGGDTTTGGDGTATEDEMVLGEGEYKANLGLTDGGWWPCNSMEIDSVKVTGEGTYSFTVDVEKVAGYAGAESTGFKVLVIDIIGAAEAFKDYKVTDVTVKANGTEVALDESKLIIGDIEEKGNFRIEIFNEYGDTKNDPGIDATATKYSKLEVSFTIDDPKTTDTDTTDTENTNNTDNNKNDIKPTQTADTAEVAMLVTLAALAAGVVVAAKKRATE